MIKAFADKIVWLGHDGFVLMPKRRFILTHTRFEGGPVADLIFISHEHF